MAVAGGKSTQFKLSQSPRGINETELDVMWQQLRSAIDQIFAENSSKLSFEELYRCVLRRLGRDRPVTRGARSCFHCT
jgi:hypothetical protein